jgi:hypothetical protein
MYGRRKMTARLRRQGHRDRVHRGPANELP